MLHLFLACSTEFRLDLALTDVNPTSPTYEQMLSLEDYEGSVSAWYFGHST